MDSVEIILKKLTEKYLSYNLVDTAIFYAERLYYENPMNDYNLFILATCYYRLGKMKQVYLILQDTVQNTLVLDNKYLFALVCIALDKYNEAEHILTNHHHHINGQVSQLEKLTLQSVKDTPGGANGVFLLGRICRRQHRKDISIIYYKLCLLMDPYLWCAIAELSEMGIAINTNQLFSCSNKKGESNISTKPSSNSSSSLTENKYYSVKTLLGSTNSDRLKQFSNVENLSLGKSSSSDIGDVASTSQGYGGGGGGGTVRPGAPQVSMSLGLSSMSLHVPFASPSSMPSPYNNNSSNNNNNNNSISGAVFSSSSVINHSNDDKTFSMREIIDLHSEISHHKNHDAASVSSVFEMNTTLNMNISNSINSYSEQKPIKYGDQSYDSRSSLPNNSGIRDPRAILFGISTPGLTPIPPSMNDTGTYSFEDIIAVPSAMTNWNNAGSDQSQLSNVKIDDTSQIAAGNVTGGSTVNINTRRVSFGPMARLSFSGAYSGDMSSLDHIVNTDTDITHSKSEVRDGIATVIVDSSSNSFVEEEYPFKVPRKNKDTPNDSIANNELILQQRSSTETNRNLPRKSLSPFPMIHHNNTTITTIHNNVLNSKVDDLKGEDNQQSPQQRKKYGAKTTLIVNNENIDVNTTHNNEETYTTNNDIHSNNHNSSIVFLEELMIRFATAYQMLCLYCCRACIEELQKLPNSHFRSALVSQWIGKAYYEMNEYKPATLAFREMLRAEPFRLKGLEILSTVLWHLKRDKELCSLAQQVVDVDKLSPETWCVVGNCFSLQKEPDTAIRFFHRAIQIDPRYTYAYTLTGHEQVNNEDLEKAIESFRTSILYNDRHYNAWYGLGSIYYRQERYELAEYHFRRALTINPASSVLHCYLGMALHAQGNDAKSLEALDIISKACEKDKKNPQLHFQRAHILAAIGIEDHLDEALNALHIVEEQVPKEPPVHALLGQVYHRKGNLQKAVWHLNIAMDLDPKEAAPLKAMLEHIDDIPME